MDKATTKRSTNIVRKVNFNLENSHRKMKSVDLRENLDLNDIEVNMDESVEELIRKSVLPFGPKTGMSEQVSPKNADYPVQTEPANFN